MTVMKKPTQKRTKTATSFRLSDESLAKIAKLQERFGISATAVVEMAVREMARKAKV
jgi:predicted transcriptional regulator